MKSLLSLIYTVVSMAMYSTIAVTSANAQASDIFFAINDQVQKQGSTTINLAGTYSVNGITIVIANAGGTAVAEYDETGDWIRLRNAKITTTSAPIDNVKFSIFRTFQSLPTGTVTYAIGGSGTFSRSMSSNDPIDWITARGVVESNVLGGFSSPPPNPPQCAEKLTDCATNSVATWQFNLTSPNGGFKATTDFGSGGIGVLPAGADDLRADFWIHLEKNTDSLTITAAPGIRVKVGPPAGDGEFPGDDPVCAIPCPKGTRCLKGKCIPKLGPDEDFPKNLDAPNKPKKGSLGN